MNRCNNRTIFLKHQFQVHLKYHHKKLSPKTNKKKGKSKHKFFQEPRII